MSTELVEIYIFLVFADLLTLIITISGDAFVV